MLTSRTFAGLLCARTQTLEGFFGKIPVWLRVLLRRKEVFWLIGFSTCLSLFVEEPKRRAELGKPETTLPMQLRSTHWFPLYESGIRSSTSARIWLGYRTSASLGTHRTFWGKYYGSRSNGHDHGCVQGKNDLGIR